MSNKDDSNPKIEECMDALTTRIKPQKVVEESGLFYDDMEWFLLVKILTDPSIIGEIIEIIPDHEKFSGSSGSTPHGLIFRAMINLYDDGKPVDWISLYGECENIRSLDGRETLYSRGDIFELEFQRMANLDKEKNRILAKFCAEKVMKRYRASDRNS